MRDAVAWFSLLGCAFAQIAAPTLSLVGAVRCFVPKERHQVDDPHLRWSDGDAQWCRTVPCTLSKWGEAAGDYTRTLVATCPRCFTTEVGVAVTIARGSAQLVVVDRHHGRIYATHDCQGDPCTLRVVVQEWPIMETDIDVELLEVHVVTTLAIPFEVQACVGEAGYDCSSSPSRRTPSATSRVPP